MLRHYNISMGKQKAPGKRHRNGLSLKALFKLWPDDEAAEKWFVENRWPSGIACPHCGSVNVQTGAKHKTMPYRCRDCDKRFSAKTGTSLEGSNLGFQTWVIAIYLVTTDLKGVSSMKLHRDLEITQKSSLVPSSPHPQGLGQGGRSIFRSCRSGRNLHWWEREEQALPQEAPRRSRGSGENSGRRSQGPGNQPG